MHRYLCVILKALFYISLLITYFDDLFTIYLHTPFISTTLYSFSLDFTLIMTLKITLSIMFLIVIRGCIPRYRYDFLTKIGWIKFLSYVLSFFLCSTILYLLW